MAQPVTLVTGASSGLGELFARRCAARGDRLALVARRKNRLKKIAKDFGKDTIVVAEDLSDYDAAEAVIEAIEKKGCYVKTLINNAGFGLRGSFPDLPLGDQLDMIQVNITALTELCHRTVPMMKAAGEGAILNVASTAAFQAGPEMATYYATKAFVLSLSEALHEELAPHGIAVTALCPGATRTEFADVRRHERFATLPEIFGRPGSGRRCGHEGARKEQGDMCARHSQQGDGAVRTRNAAQRHPRNRQAASEIGSLSPGSEAGLRQILANSQSWNMRTGLCFSAAGLQVNQ